MPTDTTPGEMPETEEPTEPVEAQPTKQQEPFDKERAMETIKAQRESEKAALAQLAQLQKQLKKFEEAEKARQEAELSEVEKLQKRLAETEAKAKQIERENLQRQVAAKMQLPEALALRLQGDTAEEMEADAKTLLESLPKPAKPHLSATQPNGAEPPRETDDQRRQRLYSSGGVVGGGFNTDAAMKLGGGVLWPEDKK